MYGYIRQGRRTALTRETIGGVPFWVLTAGVTCPTPHRAATASAACCGGWRGAA